MAVKIATDDCVACAACVEACPVGALTVDDVCVVDEAACIDCGTCIDECPTDAISA